MRSRRLIEELPPLPPPPERSFWQLLPRRNFKRALLLIAIVAVLALKRSGGLSLDRMFEQFAPAVPTHSATPAGGFQHIEVRPAAPAPRQK